jgi:hypothetical protein
MPDRMKILFAFFVFSVSCGGSVFAQSSSERVSGRPTGNDALVAWATVWGDVGRTGVFTCDEWKRYAARLFNEADKNRDGFLTAAEFEAIRKADPMFKNADIGYFDDDRDGRVSRNEFLDKPNLFFVKYDRKRECRVTFDNIMDVAAESEKARERPRR